MFIIRYIHVDGDYNYYYKYKYKIKYKYKYWAISQFNNWIEFPAKNRRAEKEDKSYHEFSII